MRGLAALGCCCETVQSRDEVAALGQRRAWCNAPWDGLVSSQKKVDISA